MEKELTDNRIDSISSPLKVGDKMPSFTLPDANGKEISSDKLLIQGSLILSFYRGGWCPYCNFELRALQKLLPEFEKSNATLVAISPENPDRSLSTQEKNELKFPVLSDSNNKVARSMGLAKEKDKLPIPASYVVDTNGNIRFAFVNSDYIQRAEPSDILKSVTLLNAE